MIIQVALGNEAKESATILPADAEYFKISDSFGESDMQLTGSSPEMLVNLVNSDLLPKDARIAERKDLEVVISKANNFFQGVYVGCGLNLDSRHGNYKINPNYAENLANDLRGAGIDLKHAKLIPYNILTKDFRLSKKGKDIAGKTVFNIGDFKWDYEPTDSGLFGACLGWLGGWDCWLEYLANSDGGGRVVVVSGEATSQKFLDKYASKFRKDRDDAIAQLQEQYAKRESDLRIE